MALVSDQPPTRHREPRLTSLSEAIGPLQAAAIGRCTSSWSARCAKRSTGHLGPDDALPPERDLASDFGVSRITVRKAIDGLVSEGLLVRRHGSGTFVRVRVEKNFSKLTSFSEDMRARGRTPRSVWLRRSEGTVTPEEAMTLRSSPGTPVFRFHRIRYADDAPMALEYATVVADCLPSLEAVETSLYEALERTGHRPVRALQRLRAVLFTREQAELLRASRATRGCWSSGSASCGRARDRVLAVLLSRRHLRLRRRAEHAVMPDTRMFREAAAAPMWCARSCGAIATSTSNLERCVRRMPPRAVVTCARGSSDHAATFAKYLIETRLACSLPPRRRPSARSTRRRPISRACCSCDLAIRRESGSARCRGSGPGCGCARARARQRRVLAARAHRPSRPSARRRRRNQRRGDEVVPRLTRRDRAPRGRLDTGPRTSAGARAGAGPARTCLAARLERRDRAPSYGQQSLRHRTRPWSRHRAGGRAEAEGNVRPARRGIQRRRSAPRADGARRRAFPYSPSRSTTRRTTGVEALARDLRAGRRVARGWRGSGRHRAADARALIRRSSRCSRRRASIDS